jgi:hypothetical protein
MVIQAGLAVEQQELMQQAALELLVKVMLAESHHQLVMETLDQVAAAAALELLEHKVKQLAQVQVAMVQVQALLAQQ